MLLHISEMKTAIDAGESLLIILHFTVACMLMGSVK